MDTEEFTGSTKATGHVQQTSSETEDKLPEPLTSLFNRASVNFWDTKLKNECGFRYQRYRDAYTQNEYNCLYHKAQKQSENAIWMYHRAGGIIGCVAGEVYKTQILTPSRSLFTKQNHALSRRSKE